MKNIFGNKTSLEVPVENQELLFFGVLISKKNQAILMVLISLLLFADVNGAFHNYLISAGTLLLGIAAVGSYYRKYWVKYCFFAWGICIYLKSLISLLASVKSGATHVLQLNSVIEMFIFQCFIALPFFCAGYLAQLFFDDSAKLRKNSISANLALAYGVAICALMSPTLVSLIANSSILPTPQTLIEQAVAFNVSEKWLLAVVTLPYLVFNMACSALMVITLAMFFRLWSRWHTAVSALFITLLYFSVGVLNFLSVYMAGKWSVNRFFDGYYTALLPVSGTVFGILIGGLFSEYIRKRIFDNN